MKRVILSFFLFFLLPAFFASSAAGQSTDRTPDSITIALKWQHQFQFAGYYAAIEQGFFAEEGLQVSLTTPDDFRFPHETVAAGDAGYGVATSEILLARAEGLPFVIVSSIFQHSPVVLISRADNNYIYPSSFVGKRVNIPSSSRMELVALFQREGINPDDMFFVGEEWDLTALIDGRVDGMIGYITDLPYQFENMGVPIRLLRPIDYGIDFYGDLLFTTEREIKNNPLRVAAVRRAILRGWEYALENSDELVDHILTLPGVEERGFTRELLKYEAEKTRELIQPVLVELGHINPGRWEKIATMYADQGLMPHDYSLEGFIYAPAQSNATTQKILRIAGALIVFSLLVVFGIVITSRQKMVWMKRKHQRTESLFRTISANFDTGYMFQVDTGKSGEIRKFLFVSDGVTAITGYTPQQIVTDSALMYAGIGADDLQMLVNKESEAITNEKALCAEIKVSHVDGSVRWGQVTSIPHREPNGHLIWEGMVLDITEQRQSEEFRKRVFESSIMPIVVMDADSFKYLDCNQAAVDIYKFKSTEETIGKTPLDVSAPLQYDGTSSETKALYYCNEALEKGSVVFEWLHKRPDGELWDAEVHLLAFSVEGKTLLQFSLLDITERKLAEEALRKSEARQKAILSSMKDIVFEIDLNGLFEGYYAPASKSLYVQPDDFLGQKFDKVLPMHVCARLHQAIEAINSGAPYQQFEYHLNVDNTIQWEHAVITPRYNNSNQIVGIIAVCRDITERKRAEEELRESQALYQDLVETSQDLIWQCDTQGRYIYLNHAWEVLFGYQLDEMLGRPFTDFQSHQQEKSDLEIFGQLLQADGVVNGYETVHLKKDGTELHLVFNAKVVLNAEGHMSGTRGTAYDITRRKQAEKLLHESMEKYKTITDTSPIGIWEITQDRKTLYVNPAVRSLLELDSGEDLTGREIDSFFTPESLEVMKTEHSKREQGLQSNYELELIGSRGGRRHVVVCDAAVSSGEGKLTSLFGWFTDITDRKQVEYVTKTRLSLIQYAQHHSIEELLQKQLDELEEMTQSSIGFYHFVSDDGTSIELKAWSTRTSKEFCNISGLEGHCYPVNLAGVWADSLREKRPVVHNDYKSISHRKGLPEGHAEVLRELVVPVLRENRVVAILGVGNKLSDYSQADVELVSNFAEFTWELVANKLAEEEIHKFKTIADNAVYGQAIATTEGKLVYVNKYFADIHGYNPEELLGLNLSCLHSKKQLKTVEETISKVIHDGHFASREIWHIHKDGREYPMLMSGISLQDKKGNPEFIATTAIDITERKKTEDQLRKLSKAVEQSPAAVVITDLNAAVEYVNPKFTEITGYSAAEVIGKNPRILQSGEMDESIFHQLWSHLLAGEQWRGELLNKHKDGHLFWERAQISPLRDDQGQITHYIGVKEDITIHKRYEKQLEYQASHDALTGLANRTLLMDRLDQAILYAQRAKRIVAVALLDLDRFKVINDTLGHATGDALLCQIADRLKTVIRETDTVARFGGDEFMVLLTEVAVAQDLHLVMQKILQIFTQPYEVDQRQLMLSASIGICSYPQNSSDPETLIRYADIAMYHSKKTGSAFSFYSVEMDSFELDTLDLEHDLHGALERQEFCLHYQPKVDLKKGTISGCEALLRWEHPKLGMVSPGQFIPLAEQTGLIVPIGIWVLEEACRQNIAWQTAGLPPIQIAVNLSARQFRQGDLAATVNTILCASGLDPNLLDLELTESMIMDDPQGAEQALIALKKLGVSLSLDDFGTGYSSLNYLSRFPVDHLKIDQSFIRDIGTSDSRAAVVASIIDIAHNLQLTAIAEGVETQDQLSFLGANECDTMQRYLFSKPLPAGGFAQLLQQGICLNDIVPELSADK